MGESESEACDAAKANGKPFSEDGARMLQSLVEARRALDEKIARFQSYVRAGKPSAGTCCVVCASPQNLASVRLIGTPPRNFLSFSFFVFSDALRGAVWHIELLQRLLSVDVVCGACIESFVCCCS